MSSYHGLVNKKIITLFILLPLIDGFLFYFDQVMFSFDLPKLDVGSVLITLHGHDKDCL